MGLGLRVLGSSKSPDGGVTGQQLVGLGWALCTLQGLGTEATSTGIPWVASRGLRGAPMPWPRTGPRGSAVALTCVVPPSSGSELERVAGARGNLGRLRAQCSGAS